MPRLQHGRHRQIAARPPRTRRSPRATRAAASRPSRIRAGSQSRRRWRRCTPTAARPRRAPAAPAPAGAREAGRHEHDRADVREAEHRPRQRVPQRRAPPRRGHRTVPALPRRAAVCHEALADPGDPHFLAGRRGRGEGEQVTRQPVGLCAALLRGALDRGPPRRRHHGRDREHREQDERRMNRRQQRHRHAQPQDPPEGGKQRHVHVVEHEHLVAEHRQPIEILRPLLVRDRRDRCLQLRDVRLERDRHPVAEAALHARADGAEKPRRRRRHAEADRRALHQPGPVLEHALAEQHQPQREQRIGQRGELRQHERRHHQARLVAISQLAQPPHRRQRRRQRLDRAVPVTRGRHTSCPPRRRHR